MTPSVHKPPLSFTRQPQDLGDQRIREPIALTRQSQQDRFDGLKQSSAFRRQQDTRHPNHGNPPVPGHRASAASIDEQEPAREGLCEQDRRRLARIKHAHQSGQVSLTVRGQRMRAKNTSSQGVR